MTASDSENIIKKYYREIFAYCFARLSYKRCDAEDCAQEIFVVFFSKHRKLECTDNIRLWLYRTADNVIKAYMRKNDLPEISIDDAAEVMDIAAENVFETDMSETVLDSLSSDERRLLELYYNADYGERQAAAEKVGLTLGGLYQKVYRIKKKLKK